MYFRLVGLVLILAKLASHGTIKFTVRLFVAADRIRELSLRVLA